VHSAKALPLSLVPPNTVALKMVAALEDPPTHPFSH
jgi:hypothetical protein